MVPTPLHHTNDHLALAIRKLDALANVLAHRTLCEDTACAIREQLTDETLIFGIDRIRNDLELATASRS